MNNWLAEHAKKNLWQDPEADGQLITKPIRLTPPSAAIFNINVANTNLQLPFEGWGHVYQIGTVHPNWGNLNIVRNRWIRGTTLMNTFRSNVLVYGISGKTFPLHHCYFTRANNGTIVIALPCKDIYDWIETEDVYLRIYKGYEVETAKATMPPVQAEHFTVESDSHKTTILARYNQLKLLGHVTPYVKGIADFAFDRESMSKWDDVEFHLDGRVRQVVEFPVGDLRTFQSNLDSTRKYLLHIGGYSQYVFSDDIELHIVERGVGYYYHQNRAMSVRQVTHGDLSVPTRRITEMLPLFRDGIDTDDLTVHLIVRNDGMSTPLTFNNNRIHELYKLSSEDIINAMVGANSNVPEWQAANLEQSAVNRLTASRWSDIDRNLATEAYGYNAAAFYSALTPNKTRDSEMGKRVDLPALLALESTVYEYRADGTLIGGYFHSGQTIYSATNQDCAMVEAIVGRGGSELSIVYDADDRQLSKHNTYAFYLREVISSVPTNTYHPAVEGVDYTLDSELNLRWTIDKTRRHGVIIDSSRHHLAAHYLEMESGIFRVGVTDTVDGTTLPSFLPMETLELWLNKHPLVYGVDFTVEWPTAVITNKSYVVEGTNEIIIRARGVTGEFRKPDFGFVTGGLLSNNDMFDVKDDKVVRVVAGGQLLHRDDIVFRDDVAIGVANIADGQPYSIDDATVPLRDILEYPLLIERDKSRDLDERIESYLSVYLPTPPAVTVVDLPHWYHVFSPVLNRIIFDLRSDRLTITPDDETYRVSDEQIDEIMLGYNDLLNFDPAFMGYDNRFVVVHPHSSYEILTLTELEYAVAERINHRYLNSAIQLNKYLKIGS